MKFQESEQPRITDKFETDKKLELLLSHLNTVCGDIVGEGKVERRSAVFQIVRLCNVCLF
jgi:hypothetical protein